MFRQHNRKTQAVLNGEICVATQRFHDLGNCFESIQVGEAMNKTIGRKGFVEFLQAIKTRRQSIGTSELLVQTITNPIFPFKFGYYFP